MAKKKRKISEDSESGVSTKRRGRPTIDPDAEPRGFLSKEKAGKRKQTTVTCQFYEDDAAWLGEFAVENGLPRSEFVKQCVIRGLEELGETLPSME